MQTIKLQELTWQQVGEYLKRNDVVLVPVGSTEQHGTHLPLGTDAMVAQRLAEEAGHRTGTLVTPTLWFGWAPHHLAYPGTLSLRPETLTAVVEEVGRSLIAHGTNKVIIVNGHREANLPPLKIAASRLRNATGAFAAVVDPFYIGDAIGRAVRVSEAGGIGHAAELETSHMMHIHPDLVHMEKAEKNLPDVRKFHSADPYVTIDRVFIPSEFSSFREHTGPTGISGDPTVSTEEAGRRYHDAVVLNLVEFVTEIIDLKVQVHTRTPLF